MPGVECDGMVAASSIWLASRGIDRPRSPPRKRDKSVVVANAALLVEPENPVCADCLAAHGPGLAGSTRNTLMCIRVYKAPTSALSHSVQEILHVDSSRLLDSLLSFPSSPWWRRLWGSNQYFL